MILVFFLSSERVVTSFQTADKQKTTTSSTQCETRQTPRSTEILICPLLLFVVCILLVRSSVRASDSRRQRKFCAFNLENEFDYVCWLDLSHSHWFNAMEKYWIACLSQLMKLSVWFFEHRHRHRQRQRQRRLLQYNDGKNDDDIICNNLVSFLAWSKYTLCAHVHRSSWIMLVPFACDSIDIIKCKI